MSTIAATPIPRTSALPLPDDPITTRYSGLPPILSGLPIRETIIPSSTTESSSATFPPTPTPSSTSNHATQYHTSQTPNPAQSQTTSSNTNHAAKKSLGPIIGGVVGGIVLLLVIAIVGYLIWRRRKTRKESESQSEEEAGPTGDEVAVTPYSATIPTVVSPSTPSQFTSDLAASSSINEKGGVKISTDPSVSSTSKTAEGEIRLSYHSAYRSNNRLTSSSQIMSLMEPPPPPYMS